jgi:hypothetical protein
METQQHGNNPCIPEDDLYYQGSFRSRLSAPWLPPSAGNGRSGCHISIPASPPSELPLRSTLVLPPLLAIPPVFFWIGTGTKKRLRLTRTGRTERFHNIGQERMYIRAEFRGEEATIKRNIDGDLSSARTPRERNASGGSRPGTPRALTRRTGRFNQSFF